MAARDRDRDDDDEAELDAREWPDESDQDAPGAIDSVDTEPCPFCGKMIYARADVCPRCHNFIAFDAGVPLRRRPVWLLVGVVLCLLIVLVVWTMLRPHQ